MSTIPFDHKPAAHCETGTVSAILGHKGLSISEPMLLGVTGGIFFAYLTSSKMAFPKIATRSRPGDIYRKLSSRLGVTCKIARFSKAGKAQAALDTLIERGIPAAIQVDMFYMDYFPEHMRVHFNGHFVIVIGKENDTYTISDCYYPTKASVSGAMLERARFAGGQLAPRGLLFYPESVPPGIDYPKVIIRGIKDSCRGMLKLPVPFIGIKGIRLFAKKITGWPSLTRDIEHLSHEIMMIPISIDEQGTGGAGFRYMFATFLQEAAQKLGRAEFDEMAARMMGIGDRWRELCLFAARIGKNRDLGSARLGELQEMIYARADDEEKYFKELAAMVK